MPRPRKPVSITFKVRWGLYEGTVQDMARYCNAAATVNPEAETVTLTRPGRFSPGEIERAASFGWEPVPDPPGPAGERPAAACRHAAVRTRRTRREPPVAEIADLIRELATGAARLPGPGYPRIRSMGVVLELRERTGLSLRRIKELLQEVHDAYPQTLIFERASVAAIHDPLRYVPTINGIYAPSIMVRAPESPGAAQQAAVAGPVNWASLAGLAREPAPAGDAGDDAGSGPRRPPEPRDAG